MERGPGVDGRGANGKAPPAGAPQQNRHYALTKSIVPVCCPRGLRHSFGRSGAIPARSAGMPGTGGSAGAKIENNIIMER